MLSIKFGTDRAANLKVIAKGAKADRANETAIKLLMAAAIVHAVEHGNTFYMNTLHRELTAASAVALKTYVGNVCKVFGLGVNKEDGKPFMVFDFRSKLDDVNFEKTADQGGYYLTSTKVDRAGNELSDETVEVRKSAKGLIVAKMLAAEDADWTAIQTVAEAARNAPVEYDGLKKMETLLASLTKQGVLSGFSQGALERINNILVEQSNGKRSVAVTTEYNKGKLDDDEKAKMLKRLALDEMARANEAAKTEETANDNPAASEVDKAKVA